MGLPRLDRIDQNYLINGGLDYWQHNNNKTDPTSLAGYNSVDRFTVTTFNMTNLISAAQEGDKPNELTKRSGLLQFTSSATASFDIAQKIESIFARQLVDEKISFSGYFKTDEFAQLRIRLAVPTVVDNYTAIDVFYDQNHVIPSNSTWNKLEVENILVPSTAHRGVVLIISGVGPINQSGTRFLRYSQLKINIGEKAQEFSYASGNAMEELRLCQRYFEKSYPVDVVPGTAAAYNGYVAFMAANQSFCRWTYLFTVDKRTNGPVCQTYSPVGGQAGYVSRDSGTLLLMGSFNASRRGFNLQSAAVGANAEYIGHFTANDEI